MKKKTRRKTKRSNIKQPYDALYDAINIASKIHNFDNCEDLDVEFAVKAIRRYVEKKGVWWVKTSGEGTDKADREYSDVIAAIAFRINNQEGVPDTPEEWYDYISKLIKGQTLNRLRRYTAIIRNDISEDPQAIELNASCPDAAIGQAESKLNKGRKREDRESISSDCVLVEGGKVVPHNIESWY